MIERLKTRSAIDKAFCTKLASSFNSFIIFQDFFCFVRKIKIGVSHTINVQKITWYSQVDV